jgi:hypothetical protein
MIPPPLMHIHIQYRSGVFIALETPSLNVDGHSCQLGVWGAGMLRNTYQIYGPGFLVVLLCTVHILIFIKFEKHLKTYANLYPDNWQWYISPKNAQKSLITSSPKQYWLIFISELVSEWVREEWPPLLTSPLHFSIIVNSWSSSFDYLSLFHAFRKIVNTL